MLLDKYRIQNPQYNNVDDETLLNSIHQKYYSNINYSEYKNKVLNTRATFKENISQIDLDDEARYEYCKNNNNAIACISPKRLKEIKLMKPMGLFEAYRGLVSFGEDDDKRKFLDISEKYNKGETLTKEEQDFVNNFVDYQAQIQLRGITKKGKIIGGIITNAPRVVQYMAVGTATAFATKNPALTYAAAVGVNTFIDNATGRTKTERLYNNFVQLTDKGELFVKKINEIDKKLEGKKALAEDLIENSVEVLLEPIMGLLGKNISKTLNIKGLNIKNEVFKKSLSKVLNNRFVKLVNSKIPTASYNGVIMEELEEIITDALNNYVVEQKGISENFKDTIKDRDWLTELGIIVGTGGISNATMQGIEYLKNKGATSSDLSTFNSLKETDKENIVNAINDKQNEEINQKFNNDIEAVKQQAINNGLNEQEVNNSLELFKAQVEGYANNTGINKVELLNKLKTEINVVEKFAQQGNEVFNQSLDTKNQNSTKKGSIEFLGNKSIINLVKGNYDQSTLTHELSHNFLKLVELSKDTNEFTKAKWDEIQKVFKDESETKGSYYSTQEKFARSWESYLRRGIAPTNKLKAIFEEFRDWLTNIYQSIKDLNINLSPDAIKFFDSILISNETFNNENFQQAYEDLQNEINNRREVLYQEGKTEQEVENTIEKEFKDRLAKIEAEMQSLNYKEYNVDEYLKKLDEYKKSQGILSSVGNIYNNLTDFLNETIISENQNIREISEKIYMKYLNMDFAV